MACFVEFKVGTSARCAPCGKNGTPDIMPRAVIFFSRIPEAHKKIGHIFRSILGFAGGSKRSEVLTGMFGEHMIGGGSRI